MGGAGPSAWSVQGSRRACLYLTSPPLSTHNAHLTPTPPLYTITIASVLSTFTLSQVYMATNDGTRVYTTGAREWDAGTGTRVRMATMPSGDGEQFEFETVFLQVDIMNNYAPWPADKLEYSGVGMDVGYEDGGYYIFTVNALNSNEAGGSGNYFTHVTRDAGAKWESPITQYAGCGARQPGEVWRSVGIEPTSNRLLKVTSCRLQL